MTIIQFVFEIISENFGGVEYINMTESALHKKKKKKKKKNV